jgi:hypothetical protein
MTLDVETEGRLADHRSIFARLHSCEWLNRRLDAAHDRDPLRLPLTLLTIALLQTQLLLRLLLLLLLREVTCRGVSCLFFIVFRLLGCLAVGCLLRFLLLHLLLLLVLLLIVVVLARAGLLGDLAHRHEIEDALADAQRLGEQILGESGDHRKRSLRLLRRLSTCDGGWSEHRSHEGTLGWIGRKELLDRLVLVVLRFEEEQRDSHDRILAISRRLVVRYGEVNVLTPALHHVVHAVIHQEDGEAARDERTRDVGDEAALQEVELVRDGHLLHERGREDAHAELTPHAVVRRVALLIRRGLRQADQLAQVIDLLL